MKKKSIIRIKNISALILLAGMSITMIFLGAKMLTDNSTRKLSDTTLINGEIEIAEIITKTSKVGAVPFTYIDSDYLGIKLKSIDKLFGTHNPKQDYFDLIKKIPTGQEVNIYYYNSNDASPTNNVYQIESNGHILVNHNDYKKNHTIAGLVIVLLGLIFGGMDIWLIKTKNINKNWG